jgi:hypothetical protein
MKCPATPAPVGPTWPAQIRYVQTTRIGRFNFIFHRNLERWFEHLKKFNGVPNKISPKQKLQISGIREGRN